MDLARFRRAEHRPRHTHQARDAATGRSVLRRVEAKRPHPCGSRRFRRAVPDGIETTSTPRTPYGVRPWAESNVTRAIGRRRIIGEPSTAVMWKAAGRLLDRRGRPVRRHGGVKGLRLAGDRVLGQRDRDEPVEVDLQLRRGDRDGLRDDMGGRATLCRTMGEFAGVVPRGDAVVARVRRRVPLI